MGRLPAPKTKGGPRIPGIEPETPTVHQRPTIGFRYCEPGGEDCLSEWQKGELRKLVSMFQKFEERTLIQIMGTGGKLGTKTGLGYTPLDRKAFKRPVPATITADVQSFFEVRADNDLRVFGFWEAGRHAQFFRFHKGHKALKGQ